MHDISGRWPRRSVLLAVAATFATASASASAEDYPAKPVTLVVPFSAGGSSDTLARSFAKGLGGQLKQTVVVENRTGAGGLLGAQYVANAVPDGYTLLFGTIGTHGIAPALKKQLPYDVERQFVPVGRLQDGPMVLVVQATFPAKTLKELIDYSKKNPGTLSYGSAGIGSVSHLSSEILKSQTGLDMVHIPYKGGGSAMPDLLGGQIQLMVETIPNVVGSVEAGKLRALAVSSDKRIASMPGVPTFAELGYPKMNINAWTGLFVPAGTPPAIVARLNDEIRAIDLQPDYLERTQKAGNEVATPTTPAEFASFIKDELARWKSVAKASQIEPE